MKYTVTVDDSIGIFHLHESRLDSTNVSQIKAELLLVTQNDIDVLILDFSDVEFCDSSGLGAILLAQRIMNERDNDLAVVDSIGKIRNLLDIAQLTNIIPVFPSLDAARTAVVDE
jgi:anti-sigma B factor antagonist